MLNYRTVIFELLIFFHQVQEVFQLDHLLQRQFHLIIILLEAEKALSLSCEEQSKNN